MKQTLTANEAAATLVARMMMGIHEFNGRVVGVPIPNRPETLGRSRARWASAALHEELAEFEEATAKGDVVEAADALIDLVYFALGRLVEMGVPAKAVFDEVQRANMTKERGELSKRPGAQGFDAVKPDGWEGPNHAWLLELDMDFVESLQERAAKWDALSPVLKRVSEVRQAKGRDYNATVDLRDYFPFGHFSYAQMLHVKTLRVQSLVASGNVPAHEKLVDTLDDLINYSTYYAEAIDEGLLPANTSGTGAR